MLCSILKARETYLASNLGGKPGIFHVIIQGKAQFSAEMKNHPVQKQ